MSLFFIVIGFLLISFGCSNQIQTISEEEANEINASEYFPALVTRNEYISSNEDGTSQTFIEVAKFNPALNNETERMIEVTHYQGQIALGHKVTQYTVTNNEIIDENNTLQLVSRNKWESNGEKFYIVGVNKTVKVHAGTYKKCVEVLRVDPDTHFQSLYTYAPNVGVIKLTSKSKNKEVKVLAELFSTSSVQYSANSARKKDESHVGSSQKEKNNTIEEKNTTGTLVNKKTSTLKLSTFERKVNQISFEQLNVNILHRPTFEEETDYYKISYVINNSYSNISETLQIFSDKELNIRQIYWNSKEPLNEEMLLAIQWILMSLEENITTDKTNDFLFYPEFNQQTFGDFNVEMTKNNKGFIFDAFIK